MEQEIRRKEESSARGGMVLSYKKLQNYNIKCNQRKAKAEFKKKGLEKSRK